MSIAAKWQVSVDLDLPPLPSGAELEIRLHSDRNSRISRFTDVSKHDPEAGLRERRPLNRDHFFPVVDVDLADDWEGVGRFENFGTNDFLYINGQANVERMPVSNTVKFSNDLLQHWENSVFVHNPQIRMKGFDLRKTIKAGRKFVFNSLSPDWTGELSVCRTEGREFIILYSVRVEFLDRQAKNLKPSITRSLDVHSPSTENLLTALDGLVAFILGSVNETPHSPVRGGFHLFYDMDARTYRVPHWMWSWGPAIKLLLDVNTNGTDLGSLNGGDLRAVAERAGRTTLRFLERDPSHPAYGLITVRWNTRVDTERGFQQYLSPADTHFLVGWGWIPLYEKTGDMEFLEAAKLAAEAESRLVSEFGIPPMDYIEDDRVWKNFTLDEAGFTPEGLAELFGITGDDKVKQTAVDFMDNMINIFESPNGLWYRQYYHETNTASDVDFSRGGGWAMEGLLAMDRMIPDSIYLEKAIRFAEVLLNHQRPEGCWYGHMQGTLNDNGITEKGTALWCLLFYYLHKRTGDERHLRAARKALSWCLQNQQDGDDYHAFGGIPGVSSGSGVVFRPWFRLICLYTCAFTGLAVIEELKIRKAW